MNLGQEAPKPSHPSSTISLEPGNPTPRFRGRCFSVKFFLGEGGGGGGGGGWGV